MSNTNVVRTGLTSFAQTSQYVGKPLKVLPNSTLNQKLSIFPDMTPSTNEFPVTRYLAIGNGGHGFIIGGNGRVKWQAKHHLVRHTAMYNQLPFVLRLPENDLSPAERLRYRLRRIEQHHGKTYVAYYLRVLDLSLTEPLLEMRHVEDGVTTATPYEPTIEDANPVPPTLVSGGAVVTTGDYLAATAKVPFAMDSNDVQEFVNAVKIIEGEDGYAVISEIATVMGVDKTVQGDFNGTMTSYTEAIYSQITAFISTAWVMEYQTDGIRMTIDVGNVEPILAVQP